MNETIIVLKNRSDAVSAERKLLDAGIAVQMTNSPGHGKPGGGIYLVVNSNDSAKVRLLLGDKIQEIINRDLRSSR